MDRLRALEIFKTVAERGGFAKAADALDLSNSATTRAVQDLEHKLGVRLLQRSTRNVSLTPEGADVLERARMLLDAYGELTISSKLSVSEPTGDIRISAPVTFGTRHLGPVLADFMAKHPKVRLDLQLSDALVDHVGLGIDLAVRLGWDLPESMIARQVGEVPMGIYASPGYLMQRGRPAHPSQLLPHQCLTYNGAGRVHHWNLSHRSGEHFDLPARGAFNSNNGEALVAAAVHGSGLVMLPGFLADAELARGGLEQVLTDWQVSPLGIHLVYSSRRHQPLRVRMLIDHLAEALTARTDRPRTASMGREPQHTDPPHFNLRSIHPPGAVPGVFS